MSFLLERRTNQGTLIQIQISEPTEKTIGICSSILVLQVFLLSNGPRYPATTLVGTLTSPIFSNYDGFSFGVVLCIVSPSLLLTCFHNIVLLFATFLL
jgi:hypothetical protein